jgi:nicotinamidase-related amidase
MADALLALHFQNDICHPDGRIPFSLDREAGEAAEFLERSRLALATARSLGWTIVHVHIAFAADYADLPRNCRLFQAVETFGALQHGSWGAAPLAGFEPQETEIALVHNRNSAFRETGLELRLRECQAEHVHVMGLATQFSLEHTVRDASDLGYAVRVLADCCASADHDAHRASLRTMSMLADIVTAEQLASV